MRHWVLFFVSIAVGCASSAKPQPSDPSAVTANPDGPADTPATEEKLGSLPKEAIRAVVRENMRKIQNCYDAELESDGDLAGKVVVTFKISKEGTVDSASVTESTLGSVAVERCMVNEIRRWEFPEPENDGVVIVNYPFNLSAP